MAAAVAGALSVPAVAGAITIDGITFADGAIFETIDLFEAEAFGDGFGNDDGLINNAGEKLVGIGIVNRIRENNVAAGNPILWQNGDNGRELTFYFYNYAAEYVTPITGSLAEIGFSGGIVRLYSDSTPNFAPTATQAGGIATATDGNLWLELTGSAIGFEASSDFGPSGNPITLRSIGPLTAGSVGGFGLLDLTGNGSAAAYFDTNTFNCLPGGNPTACPDDADKQFTSSGQLGGQAFTSPAGWAFFGTGEVQNVARVPEPATLALIGLGLAGLGIRSRRKA
jgi:hypothetical protein